jgi:pimeloyl-ACP methyl ester carboxylesterase
MMREPAKPQSYNPALEREKKNPAPETQQSPKPQDTQNQTEQGKLENPSTAQYEVLLEQIAHDMGYEDKLTAEQQALLEKFGYSDGGLIDGPFGFEMRSFVPSNTEYPHPILAFRGAELSKIKDLVASLEPQSVGLQQFNANRRRIELELQKLSKHGKVWLTGHSLGGALAQLAGSEFADLIERIITFQSPGIDAKHVAQIKRHNREDPTHQVLSTHYQVAGDVVSGAGQALTPGELVKFDMNPSNGANLKHYAIGMIAGTVVGPGTGVVVKAASEAVAKHRAFPVSNAVQENPAFQDLFENGKKFDKVAGISDNTFQAKATINSDVFQNTRISEFLRHTIGKASFEIENATSNWGGDAKARDFAESNKRVMSQFNATQLLEHLNRLLDGWVSDDDIQAFETICYGVRDPKTMNEIRSTLSPRLDELHSDKQRKWVEDALNFRPVKDDQAVQRDALGTESNSKPNIQNLTGGNTLESTQRKELEEHFDVNLEHVRIHTDDNAQKIAKDLNAKAATIGENIIMGENASTTDKELMGHEIAHVIQQRSGKVETGIDKDQSLEAAAQLEGQNFAAGTKVRGKRAMLEPRKPSADAVQRKDAPKTPVTIKFEGQSAKEATFKPYTRGVLEDMMRKAGISSCTITSTTRTPHDQARIFYLQLTGQLGSAVYAAPGEAVKAVGQKAINNGKTRDEAIAAMEAKIRTFDPLSKVSKHLADPDVLNVFDVAPNSVSSSKQQAFINAVLAESRVSKFLYPGNSDDPAYHIEVPQNGTKPATPAPIATPTVAPTPAVKPNPTESIQRKEDVKTSEVAPTAVPASITPVTPTQTGVSATPAPTTKPAPATSSADAKWTREFNGQFDGKYGIHMHLVRDGVKLSGNYYYTKQGAGKAVALTGAIDAESKAVKLEGNGETFNGAFVGAKDEKLEGTWTSGDKTLAFSVQSINIRQTKPSGKGVIVTEGDDTTLGLASPISTKGLKGNDLKIADLLNSKGQYIKDLSTQMGINPGTIVAILMVESGGQAFSEASKPIIRFENHLFYDGWGKSNVKEFDKHFKFSDGGQPWTGHYFRESVQDKWVSFHGDQKLENKVLQFSAHLNESAAYSSISIGLGQILGENYDKQGYKSPKEMYEDLSTGVRPQLDSIFTFISATKPKAVAALKANDYVSFAGYYNGWSNRFVYGDLISSWVSKYDAFAKKIKF